jgi:glycosyltransferase involved in cell wall biosynthesis
VVVTGGLSLSVVIPAYNEASRLAATLGAVDAYLTAQSWDWEVRVVDDGSADGTADVAAAYAAGQPRVVVQREPHRGKGGAVRAGMMAARGAYRFMCDADLAMPIAEIRRFLPPIVTACDVVIGTREGLRARRIGEPAYRHALGRVFNGLVQRLALPGIEDSQCGFKMFTVAAATAIFPRTTVDGWAFDVEVLTIARALGLRIAEVPIEWRFGDESKIRVLSDGIRMLRELRTIRANGKKGKYL